MALKERLLCKLRSFVVDADFRAFEIYMRNRWREWRVSDPQSVVIMDVFRNSLYTPIAACFANVLAKKHGSKIVGFSSGRLLGENGWLQVYRAFNVEQVIFTSDHQKSIIENIGFEWSQIRTKKDLLEFTYRDISIGIDIYESYLRLGNYTLDLSDKKLFAQFEGALGLVDYWYDYFDSNKVAAVIVSHDCYYKYNVLAKIAYNKNVPVYLPNFVYSTYADKPFVYYSFVGKYRKVFAGLSDNERTYGLSVGRRLLESRLGMASSDGGNIEKNTFSSGRKNYRIIRESEKLKVLISSHCFYDNPHAYAQLYYEDFYEWLKSIGEISLVCDYDWYIKIHLDPMPGTMEVIDKFLEIYPHIKLIPKDSNAYQLVDEGLDFVVTNHGSVGHEYPALGVRVINTGFNPHIAYDFNWHSTSREDAKNKLMNLQSCPREISLEELYEFYYMHYRYCRTIDMLFPEYLECIEGLNAYEVSSAKPFRQYLNLVDGDRECKMEKLITEFIDSGVHHMYELRASCDVECD